MSAKALSSKIRRIAVTALAATGLLMLIGEPAAAYVGHQHCEPLVRR